MHTRFSWRPRVAISTGVLLALTACGGGDGPSEPPPPVSVTITPTTATVNGGATQSFSATVANATNTGVTWTASGGTIAGTGATATWTAPAGGGPYTITATSAQDPSKSASATATITPIAITIEPGTATVAAGGTQTFTASVANSANTSLTWTASGGAISGADGSATWIAPVAAGEYTITATSVADPTRSQSATMTVTPVAVAVAPGTATVGAGGTQTFTATVTGAADPGVIWTASGGTIAGSGASVTWNAPVAGGDYTITATSALDPEQQGTATVTVTSVGITLSPATASLFRGEPASFTATVTGARPGGDNVTWTATCGVSAPDGRTLGYTAPAAAGTCTITAASVLDPAKQATATVTVRPELLVTSTDDASDGACTFSHCSLREAITAANAAPNPDVIVLGTTAAPRTMTARTAAAVTGTLTLTSPLPAITTPITIIGPGADQLTIDAAATTGTQRRVFTVTGAKSTSISGMTLRGGRINTAGAMLLQNGAEVVLKDAVVMDNEALTDAGGGIRVSGGSALTLENVTVEENRASSASLGNGGGVTVDGQSTLTIRGGVVRSNSANAIGGGIFGTFSGIVLENVRVEDNTATTGAGGVGVWVGGSLTITGGVVRSNRATGPSSVAGGVLAASTGQTGAGVTLTMTDVLVEENETLSQGGGIQVTRQVTGTLDGVILRGNRIPAGNRTAPVVGGGMLLGGMNDFTITRVTVEGNQVLGTNGETDGGAGISVTNLEGIPTSQIRITRTTISGNSTVHMGGGIRVVGQAQVTLEESTVSGNSGSSGAGVMTHSPMTLRNVTLVGNTATASGGGLGAGTGGTITASSVLLSNNRVNTTAANCGTAGTGTIATGGHNLSDDGTCSAFLHAADRQNIEAGISADLADNGGPTRTHALLTGSAAIDGGDAATCAATDQRGFGRQGVCDIGAFEFGGTAPAGGARMMRVVVPPVFRRGPAAMAPERSAPVNPADLVVGRSGPAAR